MESVRTGSRAQKATIIGSAQDFNQRKEIVVSGCKTFRKYSSRKTKDQGLFYSLECQKTILIDSMLLFHQFFLSINGARLHKIGEKYHL